MYLIAIGANLSGRDGRSPLATCLQAVARLAHLPELTLAAVSRFYESEPVPRSSQPNYVNAAAALAGHVAPSALLAMLQAIEHDAGRARSTANAARTLDLDIIDMDGIVRASPDPILPHPRAHLRRFVLLPLSDIAPGWTHPVSLLSMSSLLAAAPPLDISVIDAARVEGEWQSDDHAGRQADIGARLTAAYQG